MRAVRFDRFGGPDVLDYVDLPEPTPGPGQLRITVEAAGVNYADTHQTDGSYLAADQLPFVPGSEVVGRTDDGTRVLARVRGGYAEQVVADAGTVVPIPEDLPAAHALALLMQGLTAWHLLTTAARLAPGETVVVHAAAGGVGSLAVQLARHMGAGRILAQASTDAKRALALDLGADAVATYPLENPADVILDGTGGALFDDALGSLGTLGRIVTYGSAARTPAAPVDPQRLARLGASVVGFWLRPVLARPEAVTGPLRELLALTAAGTLRPLAGPSYPLADVRRAHQDLLARRTTGKVTLVP
ncbi:quinone oxidoreductase family protein [Streptomyces purpureus]|uniref:quinone oxidoreductase family protein n=1 Tax=Streptomyces purpureus TaxID=1951 RepID=UPI0003805D27|nr:zinc-binding dehydrogenase [Streptomyces purpureus]